MKTAIIFADGVKQVVFTPENRDEELALQLFGTEEDVEVLSFYAPFGDPLGENRRQPFTPTVGQNRAGYLRLWTDGKASRVFVIKPKAEIQD